MMTTKSTDKFNFREFGKERKDDLAMSNQGIDSVFSLDDGTVSVQINPTFRLKRLLYKLGLKSVYKDYLEVTFFGTGCVVNNAVVVSGLTIGTHTVKIGSEDAVKVDGIDIIK